MKGYNDFTSLEEFMSYYKIKPLKETLSINETKDDEEDKDEKRAQKTDDKLPVTYADVNGKGNIFKHIIVFTNDRDTKNNKTLKNIEDAVKHTTGEKPELHIFVAAKVDSVEDESEIVIKDDENEFKINKESNLDTLIFSRLGVQGEDECEHIVQLLQDRGFLVLNPVRYSELACNKYDTAVLLKNGQIPQPNFTLMTKEILYDEKLYNNAMKEVDKKWNPKDADKNEELKFVVKILDGHGGTGVFMIDGKKLLAVLQTIFAINPEQQLIIQRKEEADGGDIRVHVLTLRNKQVILACMKRVKLGGDFRSNVSLGATAEKVKLTPEQEQIALKTAKLSKLPWCAVDIMPLVKGSNKELGDNVVLEINASPGTDGISEVIGKNFVNILLNELDDPKEFQLQDKTAGYIESVQIDWGNGYKDYLAKLDTGNGTKGSSIEVGEYKVTGKKVTFSVDGKSYTFDIVDYSNAKTGDGGEQNISNRPMILVPKLKLGLRELKDVRMSIVKSREKTTNVLLNRNILSELGYVVHPDKTHILTKEMEKVKII